MENQQKNLTITTLQSKKWRLNNLYWIINKQGQRVKFKLNWAQEIIFKSLWYLCIILKARQVGVTTFVCIYTLDECLFNSNIRVGIVAHNREDAEAFFREKIKYPYDNLPDVFKNTVVADSDTVRTLRFNNNSSIRVGTSLRSGTLNYLHVSEFGKICAKYPDKAREIVTGALETVAIGQYIFIESTAEGSAGYFYDYCVSAQDLQLKKLPLTKLDFRFFFLSWWENTEYALSNKETKYIALSSELLVYFKELSVNHGINLSDNQKAWYAKKQEKLLDDIKREHPSTPEEAFAAKVSGVFFGKAIDRHWQACKAGVTGDLWKNKNGDIQFTGAKGGCLEVWRYPYYLLKNWDKIYYTSRYTIGTDIGEGLEQDYSVAYVFDRLLLEWVACMRSNVVDSVEWARMLKALAFFYDKAFIVPERTGAGITTCKWLLDNYSNVYTNLVEGKIGNITTKQVGWVQTNQAKYALCGELKEYFLHTKAPIYDKQLLRESSFFVKKSNGKLEAENGRGFFDDAVISAALSLQGHYACGDLPQKIKPDAIGWQGGVVEQKSSWV